ncbi:MAG TPA: hypothetical protein VLA80_04970 [Actinomycetota bacterium]|nr:hypothetical protein [Actinomycetota bacterium]
MTGYRRSSTLQDVLEGVFASDPMAHISRGYSETLRALIAAVEARDAYTHGHSARVAELSVGIGLDAFLALMAERGHRPDGRHRDPVLAEESCHPRPPAATAFPGR